MKQESGMKIQLSALSSVRMPLKTSQFRGMSTRTKLWGSFGLLLLFMLSMGVMGIFQTRHYASVVDEVAVTQMQKTSLSTEWKALTTSNSARFTAMMVSNDVLVASMFQKELQETAKNIDNLIGNFGKLPLNEVEKQQFTQLTTLKNRLDKAAQDISVVAKQGDTAEAIIQLQSTYLPVLAEYSKALQKFNEDQLKIRDSKLEDMKSFQLFSISLTFVVTIIGTLFGLFLAWNISRSIIISLNQALNLASQVASGDLRETPKSDRKDEFGALLRSLSSMTEALRSIVTKVRTSSDHIKATLNKLCLSASRSRIPA
jgi:methyl-accepting chemotaxis protein